MSEAPFFRTYDAFESLTVGATTVSLTSALLTGKRFALITVEAAPIRYRLDGGSPSTGHEAAAGARLELLGPSQLHGFRAVRQGAADATLRVSYGY